MKIDLIPEVVKGRLRIATIPPFHQVSSNDWALLKESYPHLLVDKRTKVLGVLFSTKERAVFIKDGKADII